MWPWGCSGIVSLSSFRKQTCPNYFFQKAGPISITKLFTHAKLFTHDTVVTQDTVAQDTVSVAQDTVVF